MHSVHHRIPILLVVLPVMAAAAGAPPAVRVVATAETHAMLHACDCPQAPGGGIPARATLIAAERARQTVLLLDAGGFAGGGIYDTYSEGRARDSLRTTAVLEGMGLLRYDAVTPGDEELQYAPGWLTGRAQERGVPLVSANCRAADGRALWTEFAVVTKNGVRFGITGVCTPERLFPIDTSVRVDPPVPSLRRVWPDLARASDVQVILSHLGEEESAALLDSFPECDIVVNGHRKAGVRAVTVRSGRALMEFGYQGKSLSYLDVAVNGRTVTPGANGWIEVGEWVRPDSAVDAALRRVDAPPAQETVYDLYVMSQCPYGLPAAAELAGFAGEVPGIAWQVWFVGTVAGDSAFSSLHGDAEVRDEMLWLAVRALYPARWREFVLTRGRSDALTWSIIRTMGMDSAAVASWVAAHGRSELAMHYRRSMRLGITSSPTLLVGGGAFDEEITRVRLARRWCAGRAGVAPCDSLPVCLDDRDCRKPGKIGSCVRGADSLARCEFRDDAGFGLTVIRSEHARAHPEDAVIRTTLELFPAVSIDTVAMESPRGQHLLEVYQPRGLPLYLFDTAARRAERFPQIERGLEPRGDKLTFKEGMGAAPTFFPQRPLKPGDRAVLIDPAFGDAPGIVAAVLNGDARARVLPLLAGDSSDVQSTYGREESLRWLVLQTHFPRQYPRYLQWYVDHPGSSYWMEGLKTAGVSARRFERRRVRGAGLLASHRALLHELGIDGPVAMLFDNREVVTVRNMEELGRLLAGGM